MSSADEYRLVWVQYTRLHTVHCRAVNLYYEGKHIVGIIGPECSDSTKAVASLTGKSEIALINVHLGSAPELGKRVLYPYSFGINPPSSIEIDAVVALFMRNNWTRAAVLYNPDMLGGLQFLSFV